MIVIGRSYMLEQIGIPEKTTWSTLNYQILYRDQTRVVLDKKRMQYISRLHIKGAYVKNLHEFGFQQANEFINYMTK